MAEVQPASGRRKEMTMTVVLLGIDLAKNVSALHGVDAAGKSCLVRPQVRRDQLTELIAKLPPCTIAMEACSGAHHWARTFSAFGHTVKLIAPRFVIPFRMGGKRGKNDQADAAAICETMQRPAMRFVPVKFVDAQSMLVLQAALLHKPISRRDGPSPRRTHATAPTRTVCGRPT
jgi:transposase